MSLASHCLKSATAELHREVEQSVDWKSMLGSAENYDRFLQAISQLICPIDLAVERQLNIDHGWFTDRRRGSWAQEDRLRLTQLMPELATVPSDRQTTERAIPAWESDASWIEGPAEAAGVVYVLEGSTMGAMHLCKVVSHSFPQGITPPIKYLNAYGEATPKHWQQTKSWLDEQLVSPDEIARSTSAAMMMFRLYGENLSKL